HDAFVRYASGVSVLLALLGTETIFLYRKVLRLWWTYDDAETLRINAEVGWRAAFTSGRAWHQQLFTPLLNAAFAAEEHSFGLDAHQWYRAQLALVFLTAIVIFYACHLYLTRFEAFAAAALTLAAPSMCAVVSQLSTVHYIL